MPFTISQFVEWKTNSFTRCSFPDLFPIPICNSLRSSRISSHIHQNYTKPLKVFGKFHNKLQIIISLFPDPKPMNRVRSDDDFLSINRTGFHSISALSPSWTCVPDINLNKMASKVHVNNSTRISLNDRFTIMQSVGPSVPSSGGGGVVAGSPILRRPRSRSRSRSRSVGRQMPQSAPMAQQRVHAMIPASPRARHYDDVIDHHQHHRISPRMVRAGQQLRNVSFYCPFSHKNS